MLIEACEANLALYGAILDSLPKSINRYSMWEAFLKKIKNSNPTEIYDSIRKFKTQREPKSNGCGNHSDSEGDDPNIVSLTPHYTSFALIGVFRANFMGIAISYLDTCSAVSKNPA